LCTRLRYSNPFLLRIQPNLGLTYRNVLRINCHCRNSHLYQENITSLRTPWSRVLPEKLKRPKLLKKLPAFYGTRRFISAFTRARHLSLSWARLIQSMPPSKLLKIHFNIIFPYTPGFRGVMWSFVTWLVFLRWGVVSTSLNPQAGGPPLVGCPRLLFQYIRSHPPYLEAVTPSIIWGRAMYMCINLLVTWTSVNWFESPFCAGLTICCILRETSFGCLTYWFLLRGKWKHAHYQELKALGEVKV
jgi:hypothetical protein